MTHLSSSASRPVYCIISRSSRPHCRASVTTHQDALKLVVLLARIALCAHESRDSQLERCGQEKRVCDEKWGGEEARESGRDEARRARTWLVVQRVEDAHSGEAAGQRECEEREQRTPGSGELLAVEVKEFASD